MGLKRKYGMPKNNLELKHKQELSKEQQINLKRRFFQVLQQKDKSNLEKNQEEIVPVSELLNRNLKIRTRKNTEERKEERDNSVKNSRCVSVDTISPAPHGRRKKKERFKGKSQLVKFRCTTYEKKLLMAKAKLCGLSLSEFLRRTAMEQTTVERLTDEEIELYKMLAKFHNNFKSIGNMFRGKNDNLTKMVYDTAKEINQHLKKFSK